MRRILIPFLMVAATACAGRATYTASGTYAYAEPELVYAEPGVQVTYDSADPIFYSDNYYWRYTDGRWYRSSHWSSGFVVATPTVSVARLQSPYRYRHYRPHGYVSRRHDARGREVYRDGRGRHYRR